MRNLGGHLEPAPCCRDSRAVKEIDMETLLREAKEKHAGDPGVAQGADRPRAHAADPLHREPDRGAPALPHRPRRPPQHRRDRSDGRDREVRSREELQVQDLRRVPDQGRDPRPAPLARLGAAQRAPEEPPPRARLRRGRAAPRPLRQRGRGRRLARPPDRQVPRAAEPGARHLAREPGGDPRHQLRRRPHRQLRGHRRGRALREPVRLAQADRDEAGDRRRRSRRSPRRSAW